MHLVREAPSELREAALNPSGLGVGVGKTLQQIRAALGLVTRARDGWAKEAEAPQSEALQSGSGRGGLGLAAEGRRHRQ